MLTQLKLQIVIKDFQSSDWSKLNFLLSHEINVVLTLFKNVNPLNQKSDKNMRSQFVALTYTYIYQEWETPI